MQFSASRCPTCYLGDGNLTAAAALPSLAEGFNLDDVVLVDWQRQLQGGGVGLHHAGTTVFVLAVHHLRGGKKQIGEGDDGVRGAAKSLRKHLMRAPVFSFRQLHEL